LYYLIFCSGATVTATASPASHVPDASHFQCLKYLYRQDLIFHEVITCSEEEDILDEVLPEISGSSDGFAWDQILLDADDDEDLD